MGSSSTLKEFIVDNNGCLHLLFTFGGVSNDISQNWYAAEKTEVLSMATKAKVDFKPLGNRVVVEPNDGEEQMSSGGI